MVYKINLNSATDALYPMTTMSKKEEKDKDLDEKEEEGAEEEIETEAESEEEEAEGDESEESESGKKKKEDDPDYEAELELENERAAGGAFKERENKRKGKQGGKEEDKDEEGENDDKPITPRQLREILRQDHEQNRKEILAETIKERVKKLAGSDAEAALIIAIHKNRTWPAGISLDQQLEEAYVIANRKRILGKNSELTRALRSKGTRSKDGAPAHRDAPIPNEPKGDQDVAALKQKGFTWEAKTGLYKKDIVGGKRTLYFNPKTKKHWSVKK